MIRVVSDRKVPHTGSGTARFRFQNRTPVLTTFSLIRLLSDTIRFSFSQIFIRTTHDKSCLDKMLDMVNREMISSLRHNNSHFEKTRSLGDAGMLKPQLRWRGNNSRSVSTSWKGSWSGHPHQSTVKRRHQRPATGPIPIWPVEKLHWEINRHKSTNTANNLQERTIVFTLCVCHSHLWSATGRLFEANEVRKRSRRR